MPVPAGTYGVKAIYMPATQWKVDGQYHTMIPKFAVGAGDSWLPTPQQDDRFPWIHGAASARWAMWRSGQTGWPPFIISI